MARIALFVLKEIEFDVEALMRRRQIELGDGDTIAVLSAEDMVLSKLRWFKEGNESDSKQLQDVVDVMRVQGGRLDEHYLNRWAMKLGLESLLARARGLITPSGT